MELIEKIRGLFKPKLTFEQFAIAITSDVRLAVIMELGLMYKLGFIYGPMKGYEFKEIKHGVSIRLDREVSRESLTWHFEKLKDIEIIEEIPVLDYTVWNLTTTGREAFKAIEKVE